ncbi:MAG TPA: LysE family translocator [Actinomycetota bacterium]|nr:LysE family translocator [Actinomycetota bacterium]
MEPGLVAFVGVAVVVVVTPGPDTALTLRNALVGGRRAGVLTAVGVVGGQAIWTLATSAGIAALLVASRPAFTALRYAGAAYLIYLGLRALLAAVRGGAPPVSRGPGRPPPGAAFRQGMISNLANPKSAVFFTSLLPQFVPAGEASFLAFLALGLIYCSITLGWLCAYAVVVARVGTVLRRPLVRRAVEALTGVVLTALGLRLATERR